MLTAPQLQTLKAFIAADPVMSLKPLTSDGDFDIAVLLNMEATPTYYVWKTSVGTDGIMQNGFDWTRVDNLTVGKARIWDWITRLPTINPSLPNVRAGVEATFSVEAADAPNRAAVYGHCQRPATVVEKLFAVGPGTTSTNHGVGPSTMAIVSPISYDDVGQARRS